jgi:hypothetical protein
MENSVHIIINSKGGVGKSGVAATLAGYFYDHEKEVSCIDADPTVKTFATYKRFGAVRVKGLIEDNRIDERAFDALVDRIMSEPKKIHIIDTGSSGFVSIMSYLFEGDIFDMLNRRGKKIYFHIPIVGAQAQEESISGMEAIISQIPNFVKVVVWVNEYNAKVKIDGKGFLESPLFKKYEKRCAAFIVQEKMNANTFGADMAHMLKSHMSFAEAVVSSEFSFMAQERLRKVRGIMYGHFDKLFGMDSKFLDTQAAAE